jgi:hypothetical protein
MALDLGIFLEGAQSTFKVKVSENDQQAQYLIDKLVSSDGSVTITETNDGGIETIDLTASGGGGVSSPLTTKGDLFTYDTDNQRLGVGADGQALIADSAEATGLKWGTVSADNMATADLTLTGDRTHDLVNYSFAINNSLQANVDFSLSASGDFNWNGQSGGNNFVLNTSSSKQLQIRGGHPTDWLNLYSTTSGTSTAEFYSMTWSANNGTKPAFKIFGNGEISQQYDTRIGGGLSAPNASTRLHITGGGPTNASTTLLVENSSNVEAFKILGDLAIIMANLPTSSAGLATGQIWNNSGVLNIV